MKSNAAIIWCVVSILTVSITCQESPDEGAEFACPALRSDTLDFTCRLDGANVDCTRPLLSGTVAVFKCKPGHVIRDRLDYDTVECVFGSWDRTLFPQCEPRSTVRTGNVRTGNVQEQLLNADICGQTTTRPAFTERFGGEDDSDEVTDMFQMPWMALLVYTSTRNNRKHFYCTGSVISPHHVLTSARCVVYLKSTDTLSAVRLGEHDYDVSIDCGMIGGEETCAPDPVEIAVAEIIPHPEYDRMTLQHDIAVLRLESAIDFSLDSVKPVCLPMDPDERNRVFNDELMSVAGWGLANRGGVKNTILYKRDQRTKANEECSRQYPPRDGRHLLITANNMCFGGDTAQDSCHGDNGGPIVHNGLGEYAEKTMLYGIRSHGPRCNDSERVPSVATRVGAYVDWIVQTVGQEQPEKVPLQLDMRGNF